MAAGKGAGRLATTMGEAPLSSASLALHFSKDIELGFSKLQVVGALANVQMQSE